MKADIIRKDCLQEIIPFCEAEYKISGGIPEGIYGLHGIPVLAVESPENLAFFRSLYPDDEIPGIIELNDMEIQDIPENVSVRIRKDTEFERLLSKIPEDEQYFLKAVDMMSLLSPALHRRFFGLLERKGLMGHCRAIKGPQTDMWPEDLQKSMEGYFGGLLEFSGV